jgi:enterobactin synthetase component D
MPDLDVETLFDLQLLHGRAVALAIPGDDALDALAAILEPAELDLAREWAPARRRTWVAGRAALRTALQRSALPAPAVLSDDRGAPILPPGVLGSVSHKEDVAVALVVPASDPATHIGVDVEPDGPLRFDVSRKVLTRQEQAELAILPDAERLAEVRLRFSAKEAVYKALDPFVRRYVGFHEVSVRPRADGGSDVQMHLPASEGVFDVDVRWLRSEGWLVTTARVRQLSSGASR